MNKDETREAIKVMEHFTNGGEIEGRVLGEDDSWNVFIDPHWNFNHFAYRIKKAPRTFWIARYGYFWVTIFIISCLQIGW